MSVYLELEQIYGVRQGNNQYNKDSHNATTQKDLANKLNSANGTNLTQSELADKLNISQTTYKIEITPKQGITFSLSIHVKKQ